MARDAYGPERSIRVMSTVIMVMVVAPMLAPAAGGLLIDHFGWRTIFYVLAVTAALLLLVTLVAVRETIRSRLTGGWRELASGTRALLKSRRFIGYVLVSSFSMSLFFIFVTASPYLMAQTLRRSAQEYGFWFITVSASFMAGTYVSSRLLGRLGPDRLMVLGAFAAGVMVVGAAGIFALLPLSPAVLFGPAYAVAFFQGFISVNAQGGALNVAPRFAGTASGLMGFSQMVAAAGFSQAVGAFADGTAWPMIGLMAVCCIGAVSALPLVRPAPQERSP
jgi:DHA1 family bicyclomycin/chloramphenicol resistance-like MFS transporter